MVHLLEMFDQQDMAVPAITTLAAAIIAIVFYLYLSKSRTGVAPFNATVEERSPIAAALADELPESVFFRSSPVFAESLGSYFALQESEIIPQCIVRPRNAAEVSAAVTILKRDYDEERESGRRFTPFAVRGGGHSPVPGSANTQNGILIDLRLLSDVIPSEDRQTVVIGAGNRWKNVNNTLEQFGIAVAGGRNESVGVSGLTLGGWCSERDAPSS